MSYIKTLKLAYQDDDVVKLKVINKSLILYYDSNKINEEELLNQFNNTKFKYVPRTYTLHVSAKDEDTFNNFFKDYKENTIIYSQQPKLIAKVVISSEEEYKKFLNIEDDNIRIKPYLQKLKLYELNKQDKSRFPNYNLGRNREHNNFRSY